MRQWKPREPDLFKAQALNILSLPLRKQALELLRILLKETVRFRRPRNSKHGSLVEASDEQL